MFLAGQFSAHTYAVDNRICRSNVLNLREIHIFSVAGFWEQVAQHKFFKNFLLFSFVVFFFLTLFVVDYQKSGSYGYSCTWTHTACM